MGSNPLSRHLAKSAGDADIPTIPTNWRTHLAYDTGTNDTHARRFGTSDQGFFHHAR